MSTPLNKRQIAGALNDMAFFVRLKGENPFKARAYSKAAAALLAWPQDASELVKTGTLGQVPDIGPATASVITDLVLTGQSAAYNAVRGDYPASLVELGEIPGLRAKQIIRLYEKAGIRSIEDLRTACRENRLLSVPGIGVKIQEKLASALGEYHRARGYQLYANVLDEADQLISSLRTVPHVRKATLAGALRRKMEVINEYNVVVSCDRSKGIRYLAGALRTVPNLTDVTIIGDTITALSARGLPLRVTVANPPAYGFALLQETGSPEHLEELEQRFRKKGFGGWKDVQARLTGASEERLYEAADLPYIIPELREGRGEIDAALSGQLSAPLEISHIQGFFHMHTTYSDGEGTVQEMVAATREQGYAYVGISDHSQSAFYANGMKEPRVRAQWAEITAVQKLFPDIHIFSGVEADILPDGTLDYPDDVLAEFDFVIASVHSRFNLPADAQTERICRALTNPYVTMLGHPTGRLLLSRPGYQFDMAQVIQTAAAHNKIIEINGSRHRLDLDWRWARVAKQQGVQFCVNPDAHAVNELVNVSLGVNAARKAGLGMQDVINTAPLSAIKTLLRNSRPH